MDMQKTISVIRQAWHEPPTDMQLLFLWAIAGTLWTMVVLVWAEGR